MWNTIRSFCLNCISNVPVVKESARRSRRFAEDELVSLVCLRSIGVLLQLVWRPTSIFGVELAEGVGAENERETQYFIYILKIFKSDPFFRGYSKILNNSFASRLYQIFYQILLTE